MKPILSSFIFSAVLLSSTACVCGAGFLLPIVSTLPLIKSGNNFWTGLLKINNINFRGTRSGVGFSPPIVSTLPLTKSGNNFWTGPLKINNINFRVLFDTGSADLLVAGPDCTNCGTLTKYIPSPNKQRGKHVTIPYVSVSVPGYTYTDDVSLGPVPSFNEFFVAATTLPTSLIADSINGIAGMAWGASLETNMPAFISSFFTATKPILNPVFQFYFGKRGTGASLKFGGDLVNADATFNTYKVQPLANFFWAVPLTSIVVAGHTDNFTIGSAIFDTGSKPIAGPPDEVANLFSKVPDSSPILDPTNNNMPTGYYRIPCNTMPDITFIISGDAAPWTISGISLETSLNDGNNRCRVDLVSIPDLAGHGWIVGIPFLKTVRSYWVRGAGSTPSTIGFKSIPAAEID